MTKKTLYLNCIKGNCDPRKYGQGIMGDMKKVSNDISRLRYQRYGLSKKEGSGLEDWVNSFNKYIGSGNAGKLAQICKKIMQAMSGYFRRTDSLGQWVLGNHSANEFAQTFARIGESFNSGLLGTASNSLTLYAYFKFFQKIIKQPKVKKVLDRIIEELDKGEQELIKKFNNMAERRQEKRTLREFHQDMNEKLQEEKEKRTLKEFHEDIHEKMLKRKKEKEEEEKEREEREQEKIRQATKEIIEEYKKSSEFREAARRMYEEEELNREAMNTTGRPAFPQANADRTNEETNHIDELNDTENVSAASEHRSSLFVNQNQSDSSSNSYRIRYPDFSSSDNDFFFDPESESAASEHRSSLFTNQNQTDSSSNSYRIRYPDFSSSDNDFFFDPDFGSGLNERYGGSILKKKKKSKYEEYLEGIKKARRAPPISSSGINNFAIDSNLDTRYINSFVQQNYIPIKPEGNIVKETTQPTSNEITAPNPEAPVTDQIAIYNSDKKQSTIKRHLRYDPNNFEPTSNQITAPNSEAPATDQFAIHNSEPTSKEIVIHNPEKKQSIGYQIGNWFRNIFNRNNGKTEPTSNEMTNPEAPNPLPTNPTNEISNEQDVVVNDALKTDPYIANNDVNNSENNNVQDLSSFNVITTDILENILQDEDGIEILEILDDMHKNTTSANSEEMKELKQKEEKANIAVLGVYNAKDFVAGIVGPEVANSAEFKEILENSGISYKSVKEKIKNGELDGPVYELDYVVYKAVEMLRNPDNSQWENPENIHFLEKSLPLLKDQEKNIKNMVNETIQSLSPLVKYINDSISNQTNSAKETMKEWFHSMYNNIYRGIEYIRWNVDFDEAIEDINTIATFLLFARLSYLGCWQFIYTVLHYIIQYERENNALIRYEPNIHINQQPNQMYLDYNQLLGLFNLYMQNNPHNNPLDNALVNNYNVMNDLIGFIDRGIYMYGNRLNPDAFILNYEQLRNYFRPINHNARPFRFNIHNARPMLMNYAFNMANNFDIPRPMLINDAFNIVNNLDIPQDMLINDDINIEDNLDNPQDIFMNDNNNVPPIFLDDNNNAQPFLMNDANNIENNGNNAPNVFANGGFTYEKMLCGILLTNVVLMFAKNMVHTLYNDAVERDIYSNIYQEETKQDIKNMINDLNQRTFYTYHLSYYDDKREISDSIKKNFEFNNYLGITHPKDNYEKEYPDYTNLDTTNQNTYNIEELITDDNIQNIYDTRSGITNYGYLYNTQLTDDDKKVYSDYVKSEIENYGYLNNQQLLYDPKDKLKAVANIPYSEKQTTIIPNNKDDKEDDKFIKHDYSSERFKLGTCVEEGYLFDNKLKEFKLYYVLRTTKPLPRSGPIPNNLVKDAFEHFNVLFDGFEISLLSRYRTNKFGFQIKRDQVLIDQDYDFFSELIYDFTKYSQYDCTFLDDNVIAATDIDYNEAEKKYGQMIIRYRNFLENKMDYVIKKLGKNINSEELRNVKNWVFPIQTLFAEHGTNLFLPLKYDSSWINDEIKFECSAVFYQSIFYSLHDYYFMEDIAFDENIYKSHCFIYIYPIFRSYLPDNSLPENVYRKLLQIYNYIDHL